MTFLSQSFTVKDKYREEAQGNSQEVSHEVVDVKTAVREQILHRFGDDASQNAGEQQQSAAPFVLMTAEKAEIHQKKGARDEDRGMEEVVETYAEYEIVERYPDNTHRSPHQQQEYGEIEPSLPTPVFAAEGFERQVDKCASRRDPPRTAPPPWAVALLAASIGMLDGHQPGKHILTADMLLAKAIVTPKDKGVATMISETMHNKMVVVDKQIDVATLQRVVHGSQLHDVTIAFQHRQHAVPAKGKKSLAIFGKSLLEFLHQEA